MIYKDRSDAGKALATHLREYSDRADVLVLGLPRGGVPVAYEVARSLRVPFDVFLVRKLGVPGHEELAMGALASGGVHVLNEDITDQLGIPAAVINRVMAREQHELERRERLYRGNRPPPAIRGLTVLLVDDGLATGSSMRAAAVALRVMQPNKIIIAVPVAAAETCEALRAEVDEVVCVETPEPFLAVGAWYEDFSQTSDDEVREWLEKAEHSQTAANHARETLH